VFELRVYGEPDALAAVSDGLAGLAGVRHLNVSRGRDGAGMVSADVRADAADPTLGVLARLRVPAEDIVFTRLETIASVPGVMEPVAIVWADILEQARRRARAPGRYLLLMAAAGVVGAFAIMNRSAVLVVGAMAMSPDLLPITAACTGLVLLRPRLVRRGLGALFLGFAVLFAVAAGLTGFLHLLDLLPPGFSLGEIPAAQTHIGVSTVPVALAAGAAGILAVETRASTAVGVAISVTTVPAVAYLAVGLGVGEFEKSLSAFWVLVANVAMMLLGGATTLAVQRALALRSQSRSRI
jgi:uncharacterized hydrophobic protein (TIGR00271 family)